MDGAADAVLQFQVHLRDGVVGEDGGVGDITCKIANVLDFETFGMFWACAGLRRFPEGYADIRIAADSTMFLIVNLLMALSLGVQREQFEHRMGLT